MGTLAVQDGTPVFDACENLEVRDGVIVSSGHGNGPRTVWSSQRMGPGIAVTRRTGSNLDTAFSYREEAGRLIPTAAMQKTAYGDNLHISTELIFESFRFDAAAQTPLPQPTGDGADALRAMWDAGYRLPVAPIEISARFELVNPGTDFVWQGHKRLRGTVKMRGIGRHMQHADFEFEGELGVALQVELAAMVRDRWLMWYGRDFNDRITFDQFFGRAVIHAADERGRFAVENGPVHEVVTGNGLVRGWRGKGHTVDFTYQKFGDVQAVTRIDEQIGGSDARSQERWQSSVAVTLTKVGEHLLPTKLKFERVFGRDWGPETFVLTDIKVR